MTKAEYKELTVVRTRVLTILLCIALMIYFVFLCNIQLANPKNYTKYGINTSYYTIDVKAARGEILDRYGRPIAKNEKGYNIAFNAAFLPANTLNDTILNLTSLLTKSKEQWVDDLPISAASPYSFINEQNNADAVSALKKTINVASYSTAADCYNTMMTKYGLNHYSISDARTIMGVRFTMDAENYSISQPYTFAENVSTAICTRIKEWQSELTGVDIVEAPVRVYPDPSLAPQLIGNIGPIYKEEWAKIPHMYDNKGNLTNVNGYNLDDTIGKSGLEQALEQYLHGTDGIDTVTVDVNGNKTITHTKLPTPGNTVLLTLDNDLQKTAQDALEKQILNINKSIPTCKTGAVVVSDVNNGDILACASYPTYTMTQYKNDYDKLLKDSDTPLFNRALQGTYPPGSTFKPVVAAAALQETNLTKYTPATTIFCKGSIVLKSGLGDAFNMTFKDDDSHGVVNLDRALTVSCNVYFYTLGQALGMKNIVNYAHQFGLGVSPGDELNSAIGTTAGTLKTHMYTDINTWFTGDTVQAAIGQSDNLFTPLQLSQYASVLANDGTRYRSHFVKQVDNYSLSKVISTTGAPILNKVSVDKTNFDAIRQGMRDCATHPEGTAYQYFHNFNIDVAAKTGTAQTLKGINNSIMIAYAPYDKPQIAVSVVIEHGNHGADSSPVVMDIMDKYFLSANSKLTSTSASTSVSSNDNSAQDTSSTAELLP